MVNFRIMLIGSIFDSNVFSRQSSIKLRLTPLFIDSRCLLVRIRGVFFITLESRAEAHIGEVIDVVEVEGAVEEVRVPRAARAVLRRRPAVAREALTWVVFFRYV